MMDSPTLRLSTLRRLCKSSPSPLVFDRTTPEAIVNEALHDMPRAKVVLVDSDVFAGVRVAGDPSVHTDAVFLEPEYDVESALETLFAHHASLVIVALRGELVGVLSRDELVAATARAA